MVPRFPQIPYARLDDSFFFVHCARDIGAWENILRDPEQIRIKMQSWVNSKLHFIISPQNILSLVFFLFYVVCVCVYRFTSVNKIVCLLPCSIVDICHLRNLNFDLNRVISNLRPHHRTYPKHVISGLPGFHKWR